MTDRFIINYSTHQVKKWLTELGVLSSKQKKTIFESAEELANYVSFLPPTQLFDNVSKLVIQEGVDPKHIDLYIVDEHKNSHCMTVNLSARYKDIVKIDK